MYIDGLEYHWIRTSFNLNRSAGNEPRADESIYALWFALLVEIELVKSEKWPKYAIPHTN